MSITETIEKFGLFLKEIATYIKEIFDAIKKALDK